MPAGLTSVMVTPAWLPWDVEFLADLPQRRNRDGVDEAVGVLAARVAHGPGQPLAPVESALLFPPDRPAIMPGRLVRKLSCPGCSMRSAL